MGGVGLRVPARAQEAFRRVEGFLHPDPVLVVISGPSGVGKDSVIRHMRELRYPFHFVVTATDRPQRVGETQGVDYWFVSTAEFEAMISRGDLFEHAVVYGQHKGVPKMRAREALASGQDVVMRLDVQGTATIRHQVPQAVTIFLVPPSADVLVAHLLSRGSDSPQQIQQRLDTALEEMDCLADFDYVVVNHEGDLDGTAQQIAAIIAAEKCRAVRTPIVL